MTSRFEIEPHVLDWLLEESNPSVRYFALRDLLGRPEEDEEVRRSELAIMVSDPVKAIFDAQEPEGHWLEAKRFYTGKYSSTVWQLLILAALGVDPTDERVRRACEFILTWSPDHESGGFSMGGTAENGGRHSEVIPCLTGNMLWVLIRFGFLDDPRVQKAIDWVTTYQRFDDGIDNPPTGWPYDNWEICWGGHTCHMGVVKELKAFAEIPEKKRSVEVRNTIARGAEFMLIHHIYRRSHNLKKASKPGWSRFGFPLMYQTDTLEILNILLDLGFRDSRMGEAVELVKSKREADGSWRLKSTFNHSFITPIEKKEEPSKWITLHALKALMRAGEIEALSETA